MLHTIANMEEVEVRFLGPASPSPSFTFPKRHDDLIIVPACHERHNTDWKNLPTQHGCQIGGNSKTENENSLAT